MQDIHFGGKGNGAISLGSNLVPNISLRKLFDRLDYSKTAGLVSPLAPNPHSFEILSVLRMRGWNHYTHCFNIVRHWPLLPKQSFLRSELPLVPGLQRHNRQYATIIWKKLSTPTHVILRKKKTILLCVSTNFLLPLSKISTHRDYWQDCVCEFTTTECSIVTATSIPVAAKWIVPIRNVLQIWHPN